MGKQEIIRILREYKKESAGQYRILHIGIFGSLVKGKSGAENDVDVVVHIFKPDLFMLAGIKSDLEERLHRPVDIISYRENMNPFLKKRIDEEAVYV